MKVAFFRLTFIIFMIPTFGVCMFLGALGFDKQAGNFMAGWFKLACGE